MRLISWNINHRRDLQRHIAAISQRAPDLVALQEVNPSVFGAAEAVLAAAGLPHVLTNELQVQQSGRRHYGLIIASRWPLSPLTDPPCDVPWPETVMSALADTPSGPIEVHTTHIPPGASHGWLKIETLEGIYRRLAVASAVPRILCGDFNTPRRELPDGTVVTWGQTEAGVLRRGFHRWDAAERSIVAGLAGYDLADVYRRLHGYGVSAASWTMRRKGAEWPRRFDLVFAAECLGAVACTYVQEWRTAGLSDHAAVEVVFAH